MPASADQLVSNAPVSSSHSLSVLSPDPDTAHLPSGVIATAQTEDACPFSVRSKTQASKSQTLRVWSYDPDTACLPFGVIANALTGDACPSSVCSSAPV